jgi:hypothetical protein
VAAALESSSEDDSDGEEERPKHHEEVPALSSQKFTMSVAKTGLLLLNTNVIILPKTSR